MQKTECPFFDKNTTNMIKGVAILMMFFHHFFTFPSYWLNGVYYPFLAKYSDYLCAATKLCVPIFCFLTGYLYYFCKTKSYSYSLKKISDVLISYWFVFLCFLLCAIIFCGYKCSFAEIIKESFALKCRTMRFCWYVAFYYCVMLSLPAVYRILNGKSYKGFCFMFIIILLGLHLFDLLLRVSNLKGIIYITYMKEWFGFVLIGLFVAKYNIFYRINKYLCALSLPRKMVSYGLFALIVISIKIVLVLLNKGTRENHFTNEILTSIFNIRYIIIPFSLYVLSRVFMRYSERKYINWIFSILKNLGQYSLLMWFLHCGFFGTTGKLFQPILYIMHNPVLVLSWGTIICWLVAYIVNIVTQKIIYKKNLLFSM